MSEPTDPRRDSLSGLARALLLVTEVRRGEAPAGVALLSGIFLLLAANYFLKPARDGLLAATQIPGLSDLELKAYAGFGQSLLLLAIVPLFGALAARIPRRPLVTWVTLFFVGSLVVFWLLQPGWLVGPGPAIGILFYLWFGVFNVFVIAQFWIFAVDLYPTDRGNRLFPLIALGATSGATVGSGLAGLFVGSGLVTTPALLLVAASLVVASLVLMRRVDAAGTGDAHSVEARRPIDGGAPTGLRLVLTHRDLLALGAVVLLLNWVKTNGDNLLFATVQEVLHEDVASADATFVRDQTTAFYGDYFFWVSLTSLLGQAFLASRLLRIGGLAPLLLSLPLLATTGYAALSALPALWLFRVVKIAEDATNYSLHNTGLHALWLPRARETTYRAKSAIDTLCVRLGDGLAAMTAFAGIHLLTLAARSFFVVNLGLALVWLLLAVYVVRVHRRRHGSQS